MEMFALDPNKVEGFTEVSSAYTIDVLGNKGEIGSFGILRYDGQDFWSHAINEKNGEFICTPRYEDLLATLGEYAQDQMLPIFFDSKIPTGDEPRLWATGNMVDKKTGTSYATVVATSNDGGETKWSIGGEYFRGDFCIGPKTYEGACAGVAGFSKHKGMEFSFTTGISFEDVKAFI